MDKEYFDVFIGGTSILTPKIYLNNLKNISTESPQK
jgi:hypothetical protein